MFDEAPVVLRFREVPVTLCVPVVVPEFDSRKDVRMGVRNRVDSFVASVLRTRRMGRKRVHRAVLDYSEVTACSHSSIDSQSGPSEWTLMNCFSPAMSAKVRSARRRL